MSRLSKPRKPFECRAIRDGKMVVKRCFSTAAERDAFADKMRAIGLKVELASIIGTMYF